MKIRITNTVGQKAYFAWYEEGESASKSFFCARVVIDNKKINRRTYSHPITDIYVRVDKIIYQSAQYKAWSGPSMRHYEGSSIVFPYWMSYATLFDAKKALIYVLNDPKLLYREDPPKDWQIEES